MPRRGRLAPTPTGLLHIGHAQTFAIAAERATGAGLVMRIEDLDGPRCREEFVAAALDDLRWLGLSWTEGPDIGGPHGPYRQSERTALYLDVWRRLEAAGVIYPSPHSRKDVEEAATAPHDTANSSPSDQSRTGFSLSKNPSRTGFSLSNEPDRLKPVLLSEPDRLKPVLLSEPDRLKPVLLSESIFPTALRPGTWPRASEPGPVAWRFKVPDGRVIEFADARCGTVCRTAGVDFGDFVVWRRDALPAYELAVVADDHAMEIEEVVRGEDLLTSTASQILLYEALGWPPPAWYHTPLVCDAAGNRLAKRSGGQTIRDLRGT